MNQRQVEVQKVHAANEAQVLKQLKQVYGQASKDCAVKIQEFSNRTDMENLQSIIYQKQYQEAMKKQLDAVIEQLNSKSFNTIADYLGTSYEDGFFGTLYDLQGQGIPLCFPYNQEQVVAAVQVDSKISNGLYSRLGEDTDYLKKSIRAELSRGISNGESWNQIAGHIADGMNSPFNKAYNNAVRIARTEGHRVQQEATLHCQQKAKSKGADVVKQWDSTLDGLTRPNHRDLDGQIREVEEPFEVAGMEVMMPGGFGKASEDCNCRCCLLQRARWALSDEKFTKMNGDTGELVKLKEKDYTKFKKAAKEYQMKLQFPSDIAKINGVTKEVRQQLEDAIAKLQKEYQIDLNSITVGKMNKRDVFGVGYADGGMYLVVNMDVDFNSVIKKIPKRYNSGYFAGKSLEDYIAHEMFHVMAYQDCTTETIYRAKFIQIESLYDNLQGISKYADDNKSGNEALAEAFVRMRNNEKISPIVKVLLDSYVGRWKK